MSLITIGWEKLFEQIVYRSINSILFLIFAFLIFYLLKALLVRSLKLTQKESHLKNEVAAQRLATLIYLTNSLLKFLFFLVSLMMILRIWGLDPTPLIASAGIIGVALGFGAQTLVKDFISGFLIPLENQFNVGDYIKIGEAEGKVKKMSLRATYIEDESGNIHIIPNSSIVSITRFKNKKLTQAPK